MFQKMLQGGSGGGTSGNIIVNVEFPLNPIVESRIVKSEENANNPAKNVFDGSSTSSWYTNSNATSHSNLYVGYDLEDKVKVKSAYVNQPSSPNINSNTFRFEGSNTSPTSGYVPLTEDITQKEINGTFEFTKNVDKYQYYRIFIVSQTFSKAMYGGRLTQLKFNAEFYQ